MSARRSAGDSSATPAAAKPRPASAGTASMVQPTAKARRPRAGQLRAQSSGLDPQKRQHQQHDYGFGKIRPQQRAERRHGDADEHRDRHRAGAVASQPGKRRRRAIENGHPCGISAMLAAVERVAYICAVILEASPWLVRRRSCSARASSARRSRCNSPSAGSPSRWSTSARRARRPPTAMRACSKAIRFSLMPSRRG